MTGRRPSLAESWPKLLKPPAIPVEIKVYPDAHHSFDSILPVRYVAERINANSATGRGATAGGNAEAWADAVEQVARFLARHAK